MNTGSLPAFRSTVATVRRPMSNGLPPVGYMTETAQRAATNFGPLLMAAAIWMFITDPIRLKIPGQPVIVLGFLHLFTIGLYFMMQLYPKSLAQALECIPQNVKFSGGALICLYVLGTVIGIGKFGWYPALVDFTAYTLYIPIIVVGVMVSREGDTIVKFARLVAAFAILAVVILLLQYWGLISALKLKEACTEKFFGSQEVELYNAVFSTSEHCVFYLYSACALAAFAYFASIARGRRGLRIQERFVLVVPFLCEIGAFLTGRRSGLYCTTISFAVFLSFLFARGGSPIKRIYFSIIGLVFVYCVLAMTGVGERLYSRTGMVTTTGLGGRTRHMARVLGYSLEAHGFLGSGVGYGSNAGTIWRRGVFAGERERYGVLIKRPDSPYDPRLVGDWGWQHVLRATGILGLLVHVTFMASLLLASVRANRRMHPSLRVCGYILTTHTILILLWFYVMNGGILYTPRPSFTFYMLAGVNIGMGAFGPQALPREVTKRSPYYEEEM